MFKGLFRNKKLILVVEDDVSTAELLQEFLESQNYAVEHAKDGIEGLELAKKIQPDLVLLDIMMPGMAGFDVLLLIKSDLKLQTIPVIMCTAMNDIKDVEKCCHFGAEGYITKPFDLKRVLDKVVSILQKAKTP